MADANGREKIIVVGRNLFFLPRIQNAAGPHGFQVVQAGAPERFDEIYENGGAALILVDLEGEASVWQAVARRLAGDESRPRIVAFGHHADEAALADAVSRGCDAALSKAVFSRDIVKVVESRGACAVNA